MLGELTIRYDQRRVAVAGRPMPLTPTEYELLRVLSVNAGRVLTHESLLRQAWGGRDEGSAADPKLVRAETRNPGQGPAPSPVSVGLPVLCRT